MNFEHKDKKEVRLVMSPAKARELLAGLERLQEELGPMGRELREQLLAAGVGAPESSPLRYEYMPPRDL